MRLSRQKGLHEAAAEHYYDVLAEPAQDVPVSIVRHIWRCLLCRGEVLRLEEAIAEVGDDAMYDGSGMSRDIVDRLNLHFQHLGEQVTCVRARPLLFGLLLSPEIRIPTPITVHVDHCPSCAQDLNTIRGLALDGEQLRKLEWLYEQPLTDDPSLCRRAEPAIPAFAVCDAGAADEAVLRHLCTCPRCRSRVYDYRQKLLRDMPDRVSEAVCREKASPADLFDCLVPCGPADADAERLGNSHVQGCRECLEKLQSLHSTIYGIAERADSGIATVYSVAASDEESPDAPYAGYPISVEVIRRAPEPDPASESPPSPGPASLAARLKRKTADPRIRFLLKAAVVAAAVIPLAILFFGTRTVSGITFAQILRAYQEAENVHIVRVYPSTGEVIQKLWIVRSKKYFVLESGDDRVLYDLAARQQRDLGSAAGPGNVSRLNDEEYAVAYKKLMIGLGFTSADVPRDAKWDRLNDIPVHGMKVYALSWVDRTRQELPLQIKYEIKVDPSTRLPLEVNMFSKRPDEPRWERRLGMLFQYHTEDAIRRMLERDLLLDESVLPR